VSCLASLAPREHIAALCKRQFERGRTTVDGDGEGRPCRDVCDRPIRKKSHFDQCCGSRRTLSAKLTVLVGTASKRDATYASEGMRNRRTTLQNEGVVKAGSNF
jgi:hypothetical protein